MKPRTWIYFTAAAAVGLALGALQAQVRFDHRVRSDFFVGFAGNREALDRAMKICEQVLAETPDHAEALVWHGAGLFLGSRDHFRNGDREKGMEVYTKGIGEMDKAVALAPDSIGVRIPRGAALLAAARVMPPETPIRAGLLERAVADHQHVYEMQLKDGSLTTIGDHPLGELLQALGDVNSRLGRTVEAERYYREIQQRLPASAYAQRAAKWLETKQPLAAADAQCIGCHVRK